MSEREQIDVTLHRMLKRLEKMPTKGDLIECLALSSMMIVVGVVLAMTLIK